MNRIKLKMDHKKFPFRLSGHFKCVWFAKPRHLINDTSLFRCTMSNFKLVWKLINQTHRVYPIQCYFIIYQNNRDRIPQVSMLGPLLFIKYMSDILTVSNEFILYHMAIYNTDNPLWSFTHCNHTDTNYVSTTINLDLTKISYWPVINKLPWMLQNAALTE